MNNYMSYYTTPYEMGYNRHTSHSADLVDPPTHSAQSATSHSVDTLDLWILALGWTHRIRRRKGKKAQNGADRRGQRLVSGEECGNVW